MLHNSPNQLERDNEECPYSDLDSVPKILCPKALERQPKLVPTPPSVSVVKEVKKQPEIQSGLWFSKSGKDRRPKTTSPMPDRTLFSKVPCKKKNSSVVSKKMLVPSASTYNGGHGDQSGLSDKHKTLVPAETNLPPEQSGHLKCKNTVVANRSSDTNGSPADQSGLSDKQKSLDSVEIGIPSGVKCGYSKGRQTVCNTNSAVSGTLSDQLAISDVKKTQDPSKKASFSDQSRFSESVTSVSQTEHSDTMARKKGYVQDSFKTISDQIAEKEVSKPPASNLSVDTTDPLAKLGKKTSLLSKCRLPFVKLIRKDIKGKKILNSSVIISSKDQLRSAKSEKTSDTNETKMSSKQSDWVDGMASVSIKQAVSSESKKVSVKKLKASGGTGTLRLSSESSQGKPSVASVSADELSDTEAERIPVLNISSSNVIYSSSNQSDQSEGKKTTASNVTSMSSDKSGISEQKTTSVTSPAHKTTSLPSHRDGNSVSRNAHVPEGLSSEKSKAIVHKSKQVPGKVNKVLLHEQPAHLPASSRLMTGALKAMQEVEKKKRDKARKGADLFRKSQRNSSMNPDTKLDFCTKLKSLKSHCNDNGEYDQDTFSSCSTPLMFSDSTDFEAEVKSEDEDLSISSTPPMDFMPLTSKVKVKEKKEDHSSDICSSSAPSSPFSFMNAFKNVEEVSFQSLTNEDDGKPISFKPDTNYKFSTFLMMLKDLHDTRERDGAPLELEIGPPSAHVKKEPLVMPGEATPTGQDQQIECVNHKSSSNPDKNEDSTSQVSKRPYTRRGSSTGIKKKTNRKVPCRPARSGPGYPGLESSPEMASLPGVEFSSGMDCSSRLQSLMGMQDSNWERQAESGEGVIREQEEKRWSRLNENLQNMVPLEQRGSDTKQFLEQPNGLAADRTEENTSLMCIAAGGDDAPSGKDSLLYILTKIVEHNLTRVPHISTQKCSFKLIILQYVLDATQWDNMFEEYPSTNWTIQSYIWRLIQRATGPKVMFHIK